MTRGTGEVGERCLCGEWPRFLCSQVAEDAVESCFSCGGPFGCGRVGPSAEDAFSDRDTAAALWDRSIRAAKRAEVSRSSAAVEGLSEVRV